MSTAPTFGQSTSITVSAQDVNKSVWVSNALYRIHSAQSDESTALAAYLAIEYQNNPKASPQAVIKNLNSAEAAFQQQYSVNVTIQKGNGQTEFDATNAMFAILSATPTVDVRSQLGLEAAEWPLRYINLTSLGAQDILLEQAGQFYSYSSAERYKSATLENLYNMAQANPLVAQAVNGFFGTMLQASTADSAEKIAGNNADFAQGTSVQAILGMLDAGGNLSGTEAQLRSLATSQLDDINNAATNAINVLSSIDGLQSTFTAFLGDSFLQTDALSLASGEQAQDLPVLDTASSGIYLLSSVASLTGNQEIADFGSKLLAVGNAATEIASSISDFAQTASDIGSAISDIGDLGASIMTGNVIGAALDVFGLFGGSGPSADDQILSGIQQIQTQIANLSTQMNSRFDRIDASLNQIYSSMNSNFQQTFTMISNLQTTADQIKAQVSQVRTALFGLQSDLDRMQLNLYSLISDTVRVDLNTNINSVLGWKATHPEPMPYDTFADQYNFFYTWATSNDFLATEEGGTARQYDDLHLAAELGNPNVRLESNVDYLLNQYVTYANANEAANIPTLTSAPQLANPRDWEISAEAIMHLFSDWPQSYQTLYQLPGWSPTDPGYPAFTIYAVHQVGDDLQSAIANITLSQQLSNKANHPLFDFLANKYQTNMTRFDADVANEEANYIAGLNQNVNSAVNLYNPYTSALSYTPINPFWYEVTPQYVGQTWGITNGGAIPQQILSQIPIEYLEAEMLGMGRIQIYLDVNDGVDTSGNHIFQLIVLGQFEPITAYTQPSAADGTRHCYSAPTYTIFCRGTQLATGSYTDPDAYYKNNQQAILNLFLSNPTYYDNYFIPGDPGANVTDLSAVDNDINARLVSLQTGQINDVLSNFTGSGAIADDLTALDGSKALTQNFIALGLSRSLESSDLLRSLLYGNQSLPDTNLITAAYNQALQTLNGNNGYPLYGYENPHNLVDQNASDRASALQTFLSQRLDQIEQTQQTEPQRLLDTALKRLDIYENVIKPQSIPQETSDVHLLWASTDGTAAIWTVRPDGSIVSTPALGPIAGWSARAIADGTDGQTRLLWTRSDGMNAVWTVNDANGSITSTPGYGPIPGWNVGGMSVGPDNLTHLQWKRASDGMSAVWTLDSAGNVSSTPGYGPAGTWTAGALAVGSDGFARLLWGNGEGQFSVWTIDGSGGITSTPAFGPITGWSTSTIAGGPDANARLLLNRTDGAMAVWTVSGTGTVTSTPLYGPLSGWACHGLAVGPDALSRVLWTRSDGASAVWTINADGSIASTPLYGPIADWSAVSLSAEP